MNWGAYITVFLVASSKFLFAPSTGIVGFGISFWETVTVTIIGGIFGVTFFFYGAGFLNEFFRQRRLKKETEQKANGTFVPKKRFTPFRRRIIRIKRSFGLIGIAIVTPCIISIPIGSIVAARFYRHNPFTVLALYISVVAWAFILSFFNDALISLIDYING